MNKINNIGNNESQSLGNDFLSNLNYDMLLNSTNDIVFVIDKEFVFRGIWSNIFKRKPNLRELSINRSLEEVYGDEAGFVHLQACKKALKGESVTYEWQTVEDSETFFFQISLTPLANEKGNVIGIFGISRDISHQKQSQLKFESTRETINAVLNLTQRGYDLNLDDFIQLGIDECVKITASKIGFFHFVNDDQDTITLQTWSTDTKAICNVPDKNNHYPISVAGNWVDAFYKRQPVIINKYSDSENKKGLPEGHVELTRTLTLPIIDDDKVVALFGVGNKERDYKEHDFEKLKVLAESIWNIVKRKKIENKIIESESKYRSLVENAFDAIYLLNHTKLEYVNPAFCNLFGYSATELLAKDFNSEILFPEESINDILKRIEARYDGKNVGNQYATKIKTKSGEILDIEINSSVLIDDKVIKILGIIRNIDDRVKYEKKFKEANSEKEEHIRLKSSLLSNISHELRTPLNGILGFSEILMDEINVDEQSDMLNSIYLSAVRLKKAFDNLLDLSKIESQNIPIHKVKVNLNQFVESYSKKYEFLAKQKGLNFKFVKNTENLTIESDERMLQQIIQNILDNAIKFTEKGEVEVDLFYNKEIDKKEAVICVKDTGIGIPDDKLDLIFEEFRQVSEGLNRQFEGIGIGLTLVKKYIKMLGGNIDLISEYGKGTSFYLFFPMSENIPKLKPKIQANVYSQNTKRKILAVEDDSFARNLLSKILMNKYDVDYAVNDYTTMNCIDTHQYDLILMDINLGEGRNGLELTKEIKVLSNYKHVPIIAVTAFAMQNEKEKFLNEGFDGYIAKPYHKQDILNIINKFIK